MKNSCDIKDSVDLPYDTCVSCASIFAKTEPLPGWLRNMVVLIDVGDADA